MIELRTPAEIDQMRLKYMAEKAQLNGERSRAAPQLSTCRPGNEGAASGTRGYVGRRAAGDVGDVGDVVDDARRLLAARAALARRSAAPDRVPQWSTTRASSAIRSRTGSPTTRPNCLTASRMAPGRAVSAR